MTSLLLPPARSGANIEMRRLRGSLLCWHTLNDEKHGEEDYGNVPTVTSSSPDALILMQCSSLRNIRLLETKYGSARVQHVDPLGPAPGVRDEPCARGDAGIEGKSL